jgi:hypothetical protein
MTINMSHRSNPDVPWFLVLWLSLIVSGASTTGLLRAPFAIAGVVPIVLTTHMVIGAALGFLTVGYLLRARRRADVWRATLVASALACGWFASGSFAPLVVAGHAALAAFATVALAGRTPEATHLRTVGTSMSRVPSWKAIVARIGFVLVLLQIALGALLRHHLIGLTWHLLGGGLATLAVLVPAVAVAQDSSTPVEERRAAKWAIASLLMQVALGVTVLFLILIGTANVQVWLITTIAHVAVGSLTLLAAAWLARVLAAPFTADQHPTERASP